MKYSIEDRLKAADILEKALEKFGPNGDKWIQQATSNHHGSYCAIGAINMTASGKPSVIPDSDLIDPDYKGTEWVREYDPLYARRVRRTSLPHRIAIASLARAFGKEITEYNDDYNRTFEEIQKGFRLAIKRLKGAITK
jgi:hypothetical protein